MGESPQIDSLRDRLDQLKILGLDDRLPRAYFIPLYLCGMVFINRNEIEATKCLKEGIEFELSPVA